MGWLSEKQEAEVVKMRLEGVRVKDIAKKFQVCDATISGIVKRRIGVIVRPKKGDMKYSHPDKEPGVKEEVFADLPDEVLFKHVRIWDFIG